MPHRNDSRYRTLEAQIRSGTALRLVERVAARSLINRIVNRRRTWELNYIAPWTWVVG